MKKVKFILLFAIPFLCFIKVFGQTDTSCTFQLENCDNINLDNDSIYDFNFLKEVLQDKQYVFLGEKDHGDGQTTLTKGKLIKYLHEKLGFDVLIVEYGIYEVFNAWNILKNRRDSGTGVLSCLKYLDCNTIGQDDKYLGRYLDTCLTKKPLILSGLDMDQTSTYGTNYCEKLKSFLEKLHYDFEDKRKQKIYNGVCLINSKPISTEKDISSFYKKNDKNIFQNCSDSLIYFIKSTISNQLTEDEIIERNYFIRFMESMKGWDKDLRLQAIHKNHTEARFFNFRDTVMSQNLSFLLNEAFKAKKVIISTATSHITKNVSNTWVDKQMNLYENMMTHLSSEILDKSYVISFLEYEGKSGRPGSMLNIESTIPSFSANSLEYLLSQKHNFCFFDFKKNNKLKSYLETKTISPIMNTPLNVNWFSMYDGFFFIKEMKPITISFMMDRAARITTTEDFKNISK